MYSQYAQFTTTGKAPQVPDEILVQHSCGAACQNYAVSHMITFRHREYLRNNFTRLFADRVIDRRIFKSMSAVTKPDVRAGVNPILSMIRQTTAKRVEEIVSAKLANECGDCGAAYVLLRQITTKYR